MSALNPDFLAMAAKGGECANSSRWPGMTIWHGEHRACAIRLPLSASAASAYCAAKIAAIARQRPSAFSDHRVARFRLKR